jgi:hypothetical protein
VFGHGLEGAKGDMGAVDVVFDTLVIVGQSSDGLAKAPFAQGTREDEGIIVLAYSSEGLDDGQTLEDNSVADSPREEIDFPT